MATRKKKPKDKDEGNGSQTAFEQAQLNSYRSG